jgi:hypothetical protein
MSELFEISPDDVVIILHPMKNKKGGYDGSVRVTQYISNDVMRTKSGGASIGFIAMMMCMLPDYFREYPDKKDEFASYVSYYHPDVFESFLENYIFKEEDDQ